MLTECEMTESLCGWAWSLRGWAWSLRGWALHGIGGRNNWRDETVGFSQHHSVAAPAWRSVEQSVPHSGTWIVGWGGAQCLFISDCLWHSDSWL